MDPGRTRLSPKTTDDRLTLVVSGVVDGTVAWEVIKRLEACEREAYPVVLDLTGVTEIQWFGGRILSAGLTYITQVKGPILLVQRGNSGKASSWDGLPNVFDE